VPFVLWTALWAHPRKPAFLIAGAPLLRFLYRRADAIVTYGPHVSAFVGARGARRIHHAPQSVDNDFWSARIETEPHPFTALFVGRDARYKGRRELLEAWRRTDLAARGARLELVEGGTEPQELRNIYAACDVLVMPAIATASIREPWGLVANEAMNQGIPVIATTAVGAAAGGLVRHERNGLVVPEGDTRALADALERLHDDPELRRELGAAGREDVADYTYAAWAEGFSRALADVGASAAQTG
jgi:glycosyltransferase involved in cell wall biosynthesis